jgi:fatty acid desaturase
MATSTGTESPETTETGLRRVAQAGYRWLLLAFLVLGAIQIFLAGLGAFRIDNLGVSGDTAFAPHRALGFAMAGVALLILVLALIARPGVRAVIGSVLLFLLAVLVQSLLASLADNTVWFGGLHALDGLAILGIAAFLYVSARQRRPEG